MRKLCAAVVAAALVSSGALAASTNDSAPLAPGKPAGVKAAQTGSEVMMIVIGTAVVGMGAAMASGGGSSGAGINNNGATPNTGTV